MTTDDPDVSSRPDVGTDAEETLALLRKAGRRLDVPHDRAVRIRQQVHRHWQAGVRRRTARRRMAAVGALGTVAAAMLLLASPWDPLSRSAGPLPSAATVERVDGIVRAGQPDAIREGARVLDVEGDVREGEAVTTVASARAALRLSTGVSLRLDTGSEVVLHSATVVELRGGALYVDSGHDEPGLEVRTPWGTARDVGTQFEVRLGHDAMRVRVRTGLVELHRGDQLISAQSGTELTVTDDETVSAPVSPHGADWDWVVSLAPRVDIDGQPLSGLLDHVASELGRRVRYADPTLEAEVGRYRAARIDWGAGPH